MTQSKPLVPPAAELLGWRRVTDGPAPGTVESEYRPDQRMLNTRGTVQGGFVVAMLDDTMGRALANLTEGQVVPSSIDLNASFVRPAKPGPLICRGRVVHRGRSVVFLVAELFDAEGKLLARATSSAIPIEIIGRTE